MVTLYLPRHDSEAVRHEAPSDDLDAMPRAEQGETVLVEDDELTVRMLVAEVLSDLGYTAIEAVDGKGGLKILGSGIRIDLLVTDVGLPGGMNGRYMEDAARVMRPDLKESFITGYAENAVVSGGHLNAGMRVMAKPFAIDDLAKRIRDMIVEVPAPLDARCKKGVGRTCLPRGLPSISRLRIGVIRRRAENATEDSHSDDDVTPVRRKRCPAVSF